jgi:hypothetical protein
MKLQKMNQLVICEEWENCKKDTCSHKQAHLETHPMGNPGSSCRFIRCQNSKGISGCVCRYATKLEIVLTKL